MVEHLLFQSATHLASEIDVQPLKPRILEDKMFLPFADHLTTEFTTELQTKKKSQAKNEKLSGYYVSGIKLKLSFVFLVVF